MNHYHKSIAATLRGIAQTLEGLSALADDGTRYGETVADELAELAQSAKQGANELERHREGEPSEA